MGDLVSGIIEEEWRDIGVKLAEELRKLDIDAQIVAMNALRREISRAGPFSAEPVDFVEWVPSNDVISNDYNPNTVAPPEMRLLELSVDKDGFTQPIVSHRCDEQREVVDGFHRSIVGKKVSIQKRLHGFLPVVTIRAEQNDGTARRASTIRHNRARGKHGVEPMTGIVEYLAKKGWDDEKIGVELGMDPDEVLRFKQITGLAELFKDSDFSEAWEASRE